MLKDAPWRIVALAVLPDFRLGVRFVDGLEGEVDMNELVHSPNAGIFAALHDAELFNRAYLDHGAVTWPDDIDLAPDAMHDEIVKNGFWVIPA